MAHSALTDSYFMVAKSVLIMSYSLNFGMSFCLCSPGPKGNEIRVSGIETAYDILVNVYKRWSSMPKSSPPQ